MMKCAVSNLRQAASAGDATIDMAATQQPNTTLIIPLSSIGAGCVAAGAECPQDTIIALFSQEAVGIDVDADADLRVPFDRGQPVADRVLDVEGSPRVDQQALAMTAAKHRQRGRRRAEHDHAVD